MSCTRRGFLGRVVGTVAAATVRPVWAGRPAAPARSPLESAVFVRALAALERHRAAILCRDTMGIIDFSLPSAAPRFHLITVGNGLASSHLVAHGRGSDPAHTGWLERFSNEPGSHATSAGAYRTADLYDGGHGRSLRLEGLEPTNSNAATRSIVLHGAWYVSGDIAQQQGRLGRSEGCFAVAYASLDDLLQRLGSGRLIYADKT